MNTIGRRFRVCLTINTNRAMAKTISSIFNIGDRVIVTNPIFSQNFVWRVLGFKLGHQVVCLRETPAQPLAFQFHENEIKKC